MRELVRILRTVRDRTPMLIVEQNTAVALGLCSRAYVIVGGRIVLAGASEGFADRSALVDSYLGRRDLGRRSDVADVLSPPNLQDQDKARWDGPRGPASNARRSAR